MAQKWFAFSYSPIYYSTGMTIKVTLVTDRDKRGFLGSFYEIPSTANDLFLRKRN